MAVAKSAAKTPAVREEESFFTDINFPGMLYGVLIRSPIQHGLLLDVKAPKLPDGYVLYTAVDIPGTNSITIRSIKIPIFASYEISYKGEPVGILVGADYHSVCQFASEVKVEYEELEPTTNTETFSASRVIAKKNIHRNFNESIFGHDEMYTCVENTYVSHSYKPFYAEPQGAVVEEKEGKLNIYTAAQWPFHVRTAVSEMLEIPESFITVHSTNMGEHLDSKLWYPAITAAQAAIASYIEGKPVKLVYTREEEQLYSPETPKTQIRHQTAVDMYGKIVSMDIRIVMDCGAYCPLVEELLDRMILSATGIYEIESFRIEAYAVKTNTTPKGSCFGWGEADSFFAVENQTSIIASKLGMMPAEFKLINTIDNDKKLITGASIKENIPLYDLFATVMDKSDFARKQLAYEYLASRRTNIYDGPLKGIAIASAYQGSGFLGETGNRESYTVDAVMEKDGNVILRMSQISANMEKIWKQIAAEILEIAEDQVSVCKTDTATGTKSGPSTLSVNVTIMSHLVERCCTAIRKQRFREPLPIGVKRTQRISQQNKWDSKSFTGNPYSNISWAVAAIEVEIDPQLFAVKIKNIWLAVDGGKIYSAQAADRVLRKSIYDALSRTLLPSQGFYSITADFDYSDYPEPDIILLPSKNDSKGIGALALNVIPAALTAAIAQVTKISELQIPITADNICKGLCSQ